MTFHKTMFKAAIFATACHLCSPAQADNLTWTGAVNAGTLRIRSRAALGTGTVTLAGGTMFIQASEEGRFNTSNEHIDNNFVLSGGLVEFS